MPKLLVDKVLLSAEDYAALQRSKGCVVSPNAVPPDKTVLPSKGSTTPSCVSDEYAEIGDALRTMFDDSRHSNTLLGTRIGTCHPPPMT